MKNNPIFNPQNIINALLNFGNFTIFKLLQLDHKSSPIWGEETLTDILKSQIIGYPYKIVAPCPGEHSDETSCIWDEESDFFPFNGNMFSFSKQQEGSQSGADLGFTVFKAPNSNTRIDILIQAKRIKNLDNLKKEVKDGLTYKNKNHGNQIDILTSACSDYDAVGFYLFYIKTKDPHTLSLHSNCTRHSTPSNISLRLLSLSDAKNIIHDSSNKENFKENFERISHPFACLLAGCQNTANTEPKTPFENLEEYLINHNIEYKIKNDILHKQRGIQVNNPHIIKDDFTNTNNVDIIVRLLQDNELITFQVLAATIKDSKNEDNAKKSARAAGRLVVNTKISPKIAARVISKEQARELIKGNKNIEEIFTEESFKSKQTPKTRLEIFNDQKIDLKNIRIVKYSEIKERLRENNIQYG
ncbi:DUF6615 family protein [Rothia sp. CCM 9416]|uniref:DUF6615 family protein n=1 Tax=Rothia sp. CCM 9416 TaxID=3402655 RepID=UPI003AE70EB5